MNKRTPSSIVAHFALSRVYNTIAVAVIPTLYRLCLDDIREQLIAHLFRCRQWWPAWTSRTASETPRPWASVSASSAARRPLETSMGREEWVRVCIENVVLQYSKLYHNIRATPRLRAYIPYVPTPRQPLGRAPVVHQAESFWSWHFGFIFSEALFPNKMYLSAITGRPHFSACLLRQVKGVQFVNNIPNSEKSTTFPEAFKSRLKSARRFFIAQTSFWHITERPEIIGLTLLVARLNKFGMNEKIINWQFYYVCLKVIERFEWMSEFQIF